MSRDAIEAQVRQMLKDSTITTLQVDATTVQGANEREKLSSSTRPSDSPVWLVVVEGDLKYPGMPFPSAGQVSPINPGAQRIAMILPPEGGHSISETITAKPQPPEFNVLPKVRIGWYVGDVWGFETNGTPGEGQLRLKVRNIDTGDEMTHTVAFADAPNFGLSLDAKNLPGFKDLPLQRFSMKTEAPNGSGSESIISVIRDRDVVTLPMFLARPGKFSGLDSRGIALHIAEREWQGKDLHASPVTLRKSDLPPASYHEQSIPGDPDINAYEVTGVYPKILVPSSMASTGQDVIWTPRRVRVAYHPNSDTEVLAVTVFE